jgi:hypothetical protein
MKRIMLVALFAVAGSAFAAKSQKVAPPSAEQTIEAARVKMMESATTAIRESLSDPESARFRRVAVSPKGRAVCGEVNAKNAMGGYVGFRRFIVAPDQSGIEGDDTYFAETHWKERCVDDVLYSETELAKRYSSN